MGKELVANVRKLRFEEIFPSSPKVFIFMAMIQIRAAIHEDIPAIQSIANAVWPLTYGAILPEGQVPYMLEMMYSKDALTTQMDSGHSFLIAVSQGMPVGFASFGFTAPQAVKLHKLYVLNNIQGKGIGKALFEKVVEMSRKHKATLLYLNVNKQNKAYHFYLKTGFRVLREEIIDIGNGYVMDDYIMGIDL